MSVLQLKCFTLLKTIKQLSIVILLSSKPFLAVINGSGKTTTAVQEMIRHQLETPGGTSLMGAASIPQLEQTSMKEWFEQMPKPFIKTYNKQKSYVDLINGHRILFRPLDDEGKARSLNLSAFHIEEASEVKYEYFTQLQTRLRNKATKHHIGIISSNPDIGWIKTEFLYKSKHIHNSPIEYSREDVNDRFSSHIAPTHLNKYLPPDYYETTAAGKPDWWVRKFLEGSFENREGLVYPMYSEHIIEPFKIPDSWQRKMASDFGLVDPTVGLWAAIDPKDGTVYVYDEHYEAQKPVDYHAKQFLKRINTIPPGLLDQPIGDSKGSARSEKDMSSLFDHYAEYGIYYKPATRKLEDSIMKKYTYLALGKVKIFNTCRNLIKEFGEYKYRERSLDSGKVDEKPVGGYDHALDTLRYLIAELPDDPNELVNESYGFHNVKNGDVKKVDYIPHALQEEDDYGSTEDWTSYY